MFLTHNNRCLEFLNNMFYSNGLRQIQKRSLNCFPHLKRRKEQKNIQDTFWSRSVFSLFYLSLFNLDLLVLHVLSWTSHQEKPRMMPSPPPPPPPPPPTPPLTHTLILTAPVRLQSSGVQGPSPGVKTWLQRRGCGDRCSARSPRSPSWCGRPGRTPAVWTRKPTLAQMSA